MKTKTVLIIILPILIIITLMGGYFVYMDYSDRQKKKEIKCLTVQMQNEVEKNRYTANSKNKAEVSFKIGELRRNKALEAVYELREYAFDVYSKNHGKDFLIGYDGIKHVEFVFDQIDSRYKIKEYAKLDKKNIKLIFPETALEKFKAKLVAEKKVELEDLKREKLYNIQELKKENASLAKIENIRDKYKKLIQKIETE